MKEAIGLIEAVGLAAAIEAADTCLKSANVKLIGYELTKGGGYVTIKISGDVGAVSAAVSAATAAATKVRGVYSSKVIPRPSGSLDMMMNSNETVGRIQEKMVETQVATENPLEVISSPLDMMNSNETVERIHKEMVETLEVSESPLEMISSEVTCNICKDPACGRQKGDPRTKCISYKSE